jgi:hypothetical protein
MERIKNKFIPKSVSLHLFRCKLSFYPNPDEPEPKGNNSKLEQFVFFDSNDKRQLDGELQLAEKWYKMILDKL